MGFELGRLVREAAGGIGLRVAAKARELRRIAHVKADRVWQGVGELLRVQIATALVDARREHGGACEPNTAVGPCTRAIVETIAEVLALSGYAAIRADAKGRSPPEIVHGTVRSHRPSLTAIGGGLPVLIDVYLPGESDSDEQLSRWQLFASAAAQSGGEFHVVVPTWIEGSAGRQWVRQVSDAAGMTVTKIWEV